MTRPTAPLSERLERIGKKLIATTEFSQDAHAVLEAAAVLSERVALGRSMGEARLAWLRDLGKAGLPFPGDLGLDAFAAGFDEGFAAGAACNGNSGEQGGAK